MNEKLAIHGGTPARSAPLPPNYPGAVMLGDEEAAGADEVIRAKSPFRYYGPTPRHAVRGLEQAISEKFGVPYALGVTSGTAALIVAMKALGIGYGDKVIVPANTFIATAGAVLCCNAVPVFVDIDESMNLDPEDLARVMDDEVKAIIAVPILGNPCDMEPIVTFAKQHGIAVIEDVAQSAGVKYRGQYQGTIGDVGAFSFQMNKIITAGEGGAVTAKDAAVFERAVRYHDQGTFREPAAYGIDPAGVTMFGQNYRMSELTGSVMLEQWHKLDDIVTRMQTSCRRLRGLLEEQLPNVKFRACPDAEGDIGSNLGLLLPNQALATAVNEALHAENIQSYILYGGKPIYMFPQFLQKESGEREHFPYNYPFRHPVHYTPDMCPRAVDLIGRAVFVPISPVLTEQDVEEIAAGVVKVYREFVG